MSHGTDSGYTRHRRNGTPPCRPCKTAHAAEERRRAQKDRLSHGLARGLALHMKHGTPVCAMCLTYAAELEHHHTAWWLRLYKRRTEAMPLPSFQTTHQHDAQGEIA